MSSKQHPPQQQVTTESTTAAAHSNTLLPNDHLDPSLMQTTTPASHLTQTHLSTMECMTLHNTHTNSTLWIPSTLSKHCTLPWNVKPCLLPHNHNHAKGPFPFPATALNHENHPLAAKLITHIHTLAVVTHLHWQATCQCHHQPPPYIPLATKNIKAHAHNMRPL